MKYLSILILFFTLYSCTKEVKIDIPGYKEQLVIDGSIEPGSPAIVLLSKTSNIYSPTNLEAYLNGFISGATIVISDGTVTDTLIEICTDNLPPGTEEQAAAFFGLPIDQIVNLHLCAYISTNIIGQVGKTYSLKVINDGKTYTSQTSILPPTALDSVYWKPEPSNPMYGFSWTRLTDPGATTDAYAWQTKYISDTNFQRPFNPFFNDKFFNGLSFEFAYDNPMSYDDESYDPDYRGYYKLGDTVVIKFSKIGSKEYNFFEKKYNQMYSAGNPFATPTNVPTNITGGALGIWVGYSPSYDTMICQP
jgi:hypothetical protein